MYNYDITFRSIDKHCNADMLSCNPLPSTTHKPLMNKVHSMQIENFCVDAEPIRKESINDPLTLKSDHKFTEE